MQKVKQEQERKKEKVCTYSFLLETEVRISVNSIFFFFGQCR